jgi:DNA-binding response OmpR family regulator
MSKKILTVDDDPDFQAALTVILESADYQCIQARSMKKGLDLASRIKPDLIILDVMMEDISAGFRFAKTLRNRDTECGNGHIPILMVSSVQNIMEFNIQERMGTPLLPVDAFMDKPVDPKVLLNKIRAMIL